MAESKALEMLQVGVAEVLESERFKAYLDTMAKFHSYSFGNVMLIGMQCPHATQVAGYNRWLEMDRQVSKGQKAIRILAPIIKKVDNEKGEEERRLIGFRDVSVFDISQTEGEELPEIAPLTTGCAETTALLEEAAVRVLEADGITVFTEQNMGETRGYYDHGNKLIALSDVLEPNARVKTLVHEFAHHLSADVSSNVDSEAIAESVAYVVCQHYGIDTSGYSFDYVAHWTRNDAEALKRNLTTIQKVSNKIIESVGVL